jgi:F-type H+-transporting ATPase subunit epsilon
MKLTIAQIDKVLWSGGADSVTVPSTAGVLTILSHHMPLITTLKAGTIVVKHKEGESEEFPITSGFLEVGKKETVILV